MDQTHDPSLASWVESANGAGDFPIQNLPFGVFRRRGEDEPGRVGIAIGDMILDLTAAHDEGWFNGIAEQASAECAEPALNPLMRLGAPSRTELRRQVSALLSADSPAYRSNRRLGDRILVARRDAEMLLPAAIGDYTDFYASVHHATNVGSMFRPDNPLLPNYKWLPIGYHGRASSIVPSGTPIPRPRGQTKRARRGIAGLRAEPVAGLRDGAGTARGPGKSAGRAGADRSGRRADLRLLPGERLVGPRHPGVGVPAAGPVPGQELRHHDLAMGGDARGARAVPRPGVREAARRSGAPALPRLGSQRRARAAGRHRRGVPRLRPDARSGGGARARRAAAAPRISTGPRHSSSPITPATAATSGPATCWPAGPSPVRPRSRAGVSWS